MSKLNDLIPSDISSSRMCTPEQDNELTESGTNQGKRESGTECIDTTPSDLIGRRLLGPKEIDGLLVPLGKAYTHLTDHLIAG